MEKNNLKIKESFGHLYYGSNKKIFFKINLDKNIIITIYNNYNSGFIC